jgi:uncharacterized protein YneF (UPF0154 family)
MMRIICSLLLYSIINGYFGFSRLSPSVCEEKPPIVTICVHILLMEMLHGRMKGSSGDLWNCDPKVCDVSLCVILCVHRPMEWIHLGKTFYLCYYEVGT